MSDHLQAYAAHLDREPVCSCVTTDRGVDTLGCPSHDDFGVIELTQDQLRSLIAEQAAQIGLTVDDAVDLARYGELPKTPRGFDLDMLIRMLA